MAGTSSRTRTALVGAIALALPLSLAACSSADDPGTSDGGGSPAPTEEMTLRVMDYYNTTPDKEIYQAVLDECAAQVGVTLAREAVPGGDLVSKVLQAGSSKTLPDVLMLDNPDVQQIAATGALVPMSDLGITGDGYAQGVLDASTYDGALYGLQPVTNTIALFYNKAIFDEAGLQPPTTWDELKTTAAALTSGDQYGVAFSAINTYEGTWQFLPFMWSNGGDEKDIATPETAEALQLWVDLLDAGSASGSVVNWSQADVNAQFVAGKAAMMVNGPWQYPILKAAEGLDWAVAPLPAPTAGGTVVSPLGGETWTVPQTGDQAKQAKAGEIVTCINSDDNMMQLGAERGTVPTKPALVDQFVEQVPDMKVFAEMVPDLRARTGELGADWPKSATAIYTAVQIGMTGGADPLQALQQAQDSVG